MESGNCMKSSGADIAESCMQMKHIAENDNCLVNFVASSEVVAELVFHH